MLSLLRLWAAMLLMPYADLRHGFFWSATNENTP
jgi:hypothetical protein